MGQVNQPSNLLDRIKQVETQVSQLWRAIGLTSATIAKGGLTLLNNAFIKMLDVYSNELLYIGPDDQGRQVVRIRDAAGNIIFGSVSGGTGKQRVAINPSPTGNPRIDFWDDTVAQHVRLLMFGGNYVMQQVDDANGPAGGKVQFGQQTSLYGQQTANSDAYIAFGVDEGIQLKGWFVATPIGGKSAVVVGFDDAIGSGPVITSYTYGATMADRMNPMACVYSFTDTQWYVRDSTPTGFTLGVSGGSNVRMHYWAYRSH